MKKYDPNKAPDPDVWCALAESKQILLVKQYHMRKRVKLPNAEIHAVFHVIVENQVAMGDEKNVSKTLDRLIADGLDRHDALHAIGSVLTEHFWDLMNEDASVFSEEAYAADLDALTIEKWMELAE